ncbi:MAG TPA: hypothetical protein PLA54_14655 [Spirochaetota bacterium]|nr:hypothetical protein [Spirochaetota bacterium]HQE60427.1 hypothetical protein [Spirochaetota bacterium]
MQNIFKENESIKISSLRIKPDSWGCMAEGYYWSAKLLLEEIIQSESYQNKWVVFPILFNMRHYYELSLKDILVNLGYIYDKDFLIQNHNLNDLIKEVEKRSADYYREHRDRLGYRLLVNDITETMNGIKHEMNVFIKHDNDSFAFRYPCTKKNIPSISEEVNFDCKLFSESLEKCRKYLVGLSIELLCDDKNPIFENDK